MNKKKIALLILDGWGIGNGSESDAIGKANVPYYRSLLQKYPHSVLKTYGESVGLPNEQMGNSEVGHMNIGAGRVVYQDLVKLNKAVTDNSIAQNPVLLAALRYAKENGKAVHMMGLVSNGGVHSSQEHLHKLCDIANEQGLQRVYIHAFTDGRDTDPKSGLGFIHDLENHIQFQQVKIASIIGRYYAMDRDQRWERIRLAYDLLVNGKGKTVSDAVHGIQNAYDAGETDEFIKPICVADGSGRPLATIGEGDVVICFNFRTDRCREITQVLSQEDFPAFEMKKMSLYYVTLTNYDHNFKDIRVMYEKDNLEMTLGEVISKSGKTQIRIAETEKYPHVTFFFNGGRENTFPGERRILIPSPKVATYDLQPEMSAIKITEAILPEMTKDGTDFICLNFANADMVGHTGVFQAVVKAVETVDACLKQIVENGIDNGYSFIILADHGNADYMVNPDGSPNTAHSMNPVPCILIDSDYKKIRDGKLGDLAPSILKLFDLPIPAEMTGELIVS
jgi:2,3-bisphosphoglycerate-independent phosphoglycerate mutase